MNATLRLYVNEQLRTKETRGLAMPRFLRETVACQRRLVARWGGAYPTTVTAHRTPTTRQRYAKVTTGPVTATVTFHA